LAAVSLLTVLRAHAVTIATAPIGNPGNAPDTELMIDGTSGYGSVSYSFRMGKTEVTNAQYVGFLNAVAATDSYGLFSAFMDTQTNGGIARSGSPGSYTYSVKPAALGGAYAYGNKPVVYVSWSNAVRFANWLHNGQPSGLQTASTTEDGAYTLNGAVSNIALSVVSRNPGARWWLPSEDEWYKAAHYDPVAGLYYDYPTGSDSTPNNNLPTSDTGNSANFYDGEFALGNGFAYPFTDVGAYTLSASPYGTFDQGGSVWEWSDTIVLGSPRIERGGAFHIEANYMHAANRNWGPPAFFSDVVGFRVASSFETADADYDGDGDIDGADLLAWQRGESPHSMSAGDLTAWRNEFGAGGPSRSVPEVSSGLLGLLATLGLLRTRRTSPLDANLAQRRS
jgi:formylglycine-generating enzyme required for sulfatase activity